MNSPAKILIVEHNQTDIELIENELKKGEINYRSEIVENEQEYDAALKSFHPDIILSDYSFPSFDGPAAFNLRETIAPDTPFIFVTGTIGEKNSIEYIKRGVTDYVLKDRLFTLNPKIKRALKETSDKKQYKEAAEEITASERLYHSLFDNMLEGFAHCKMIYENGKPEDFIYLEVNETFEKLTGLKNVKGKKVTEVIPGIRESSPDLFNTYDRVAQSGKPERFEFHLEALKLWLYISVYSTEKGYFTAVFDEITEKKEAEEKLANSEKHFRALIEHNADMITLATATGELLYASPSVTKTLGYTLEDFQKNPAFNILHPDDVARVVENIEEILKTPGKSFYSQHRLKHKNGNYMWSEGTFTNLLHESGINALVSNFRDISDRKSAEQDSILSYQQLKQVSGELQKTMDASLDMICTVDGEGRFVKVSAAAERILGFKPDELVGIKFIDLVFNEDVEVTNSVAAGVMSGQSVTAFENRYIRKNGNIVPIMWSAIWYEADKLMHCVGKDATEMKEAEKQIEFEKNNLSALINNTADLMWSVNRDFKLITANHAFDEMSKINFGRIVAPGTDVLATAATPEMLLHYKGLYERAFAGESFTQTDYFDHPFEFWSEISYNPIRKGDEIIGTACHSRDVTVNKLAEKKILENEARLQEAQAIAHLGSGELNLATNILTLSDEGCRIFGLSANQNELTFENWAALVHPEDLPGVIKVLQESGEALADASYDCRLILPGGIKHIHSESKYVLGTDGKALSMHGIFQDVTEQKATELKIHKLNSELELRVEERTEDLTAANKALEAFSYSVSHDLRSPVRSVMGFARIISKDYGADMNPKAKELFTHIQESGKRMNAIIDDLLTFAKWGKEKLQMTEVDMTKLFNHIWKNHLLETSHHAVLEMQPLPNVQADGPMIRQVVINLISNAVKYSSKKKNPVVKVGFEETETEFIFHVSDNGAGFDMKHYDRLFGAFQRMHGMSEFEGTGIGLTLVKTIIEKHKGRVWAEAKMNEGAKFYFSLPK